MNDIAAIRARRAAITPGVTNTCAYFTGTYGEYDGGTEILADNKTVAIVPASNANEIADAEFYAAAPADIDTLLVEVERLTAQLEAVQPFVHDVDVLLALTQRLTAERDECRRSVHPAMQAATEARDKLQSAVAAAERAAMEFAPAWYLDAVQTMQAQHAAHVAALTAERDALAQQLQQAQAQLERSEELRQFGVA